MCVEDTSIDTLHNIIHMHTLNATRTGKRCKVTITIIPIYYNMGTHPNCILSNRRRVKRIVFRLEVTPIGNIILLLLQRRQ